MAGEILKFSAIASNSHNLDKNTKQNIMVSKGLANTEFLEIAYFKNSKNVLKFLFDLKKLKIQFQTVNRFARRTA